MTNHNELELLDLAEAVAAGRMGALDAERTVRAHAALDGRRAADDDVRELRSLIAAASAVRAHATATRDVVPGYAAIAEADSRGRGDIGVITPLPVGAGAVRRRGTTERVRRSSPRIGLLIAATLAVGTGVVAAAVFGGRPTSPTPSPTASLVAIASTEPTPSASALPSPTPQPSTPAPSPSATASPSATPAVAAGIPAIANENLDGAPGVAMWRQPAPTRLEVLVWQSGGANRRLFETDTWKDPDPANGQSIDRQVLVGAHDRVVIAETDPQAKTRVRLFDGTGHLLWSTTQSLGIPALAWSQEGSELAVAFVPRPWIVVGFSPDGSVTPTTYNLPGDVPLQLLGFSSDGVTLFGYDSSGEAAPWEKPYSLNLSSGMTETPLNPAPGRLRGLATSNTTTPSRLIDPQTGDVLDRGDASGRQTDWSIIVAGKRTDTHVPLVIDGLDTELRWATPASDDSLVMLSTHRSQVSGETASNVTVSNVTRSGGTTGNPSWSAGPGFYRGFLRAADARWAVIGLSELPARADESLGDDELVVVELATGKTSTFSVLGGGNFDLHFAGLTTVAQ